MEYIADTRFKRKEIEDILLLRFVWCYFVWVSRGHHCLTSHLRVPQVALDDHDLIVATQKLNVERSADLQPLGDEH